MVLLLVVLVLAVVGGFLGDLLEFAAWAIVVLAAIGALVGFLIYRAVQRLKSKLS